MIIREIKATMSLAKLRVVASLFLVCSVQYALCENFSKEDFPDDIVFERPLQERPDLTFSDLRLNSAKELRMPDVNKNVEDYRQAEVWNMIGTMDSFKTNDHIYNRYVNSKQTISSRFFFHFRHFMYCLIHLIHHAVQNSSQSAGKPLLSSFHYLVVPTYWSHQNQNNTALIMKETKIQNIMDQTVQYYSDMSWGKMSLTYKVSIEMIACILSMYPISNVQSISKLSFWYISDFESSNYNNYEEDVCSQK